jgi:hypothetical protein
VTDILEPDQLEAGWVAVEAQAAYKYFRPLADARRRFVREAQSGRRIFFGIEQLDSETRGISPGHLAIVVGYSHSGKTQLCLNVLYHNRDKRIALFIPDEPAPLVITKLASLVFEVSARQLEDGVARGEPLAMRMLDETLAEFPNLTIFDQPMTPKTVRRSWEEACSHWGDEGDLAVFDYLDLMQAGDRLATKADAIKAFGTEVDVPVILLHQTSRLAGAQGRPMRIDSGNYGGETWATYQIGVWRKRFAIQAELYELYRKTRPSADDWNRLAELQHEAVVHERTVTINLSKNKRPGGQLIEDGIDFELHDSGQLVPFRGGLRSVTGGQR